MARRFLAISMTCERRRCLAVYQKAASWNFVFGHCLSPSVCIYALPLVTPCSSCLFFLNCFVLLSELCLGRFQRYFQCKLLSISPQWSHHFSASLWCSFSNDLEFASVRVFGRLLFRRMFSLVFVFVFL